MLEVLPCTGKHTDIVSRFEELYDNEDNILPVAYLTRVAKTTRSLAYYLVNPSGEADYYHSVDPLKPPFTALTRLGPFWIVVQDTDKFIEQYGPYDWSTEE